MNKPLILCFERTHGQLIQNKNINTFLIVLNHTQTGVHMRRITQAEQLAKRHKRLLASTSSTQYDAVSNFSLLLLHLLAKAPDI